MAETTDKWLNDLLAEAEANEKETQMTTEPAPTYPMVDPETGKTMYGSWNDLADPFVDKFHPRNDPTNVAYQQALKDRDKRKFEQALANMAKLAPDGIHELDENGEMIPNIHDLHAAQKQAEEKAWLETPVEWSSRGTWQGKPYEILHPDKPEDDIENDPEQNANVAGELRRRERARAAAYTNARPRHHRHSTTSQEEMRELGLLPPLDPDDPVQVRKQAQYERQKNMRDGLQKMLGQTPQAEADKQRRINEALVAGDRQLAADLMDGRVA